MCFCAYKNKILQRNTHATHKRMRKHMHAFWITKPCMVYPDSTLLFLTFLTPGCHICVSLLSFCLFLSFLTVLIIGGTKTQRDWDQSVLCNPPMWREISSEDSCGKDPWVFPFLWEVRKKVNITLKAENCETKHTQVRYRLIICYTIWRWEAGKSMLSKGHDVENSQMWKIWRCLTFARHLILCSFMHVSCSSC